MVLFFQAGLPQLKKSPKAPSFIYELDLPILGILYGLQLMCKFLEVQLYLQKIESSEKFYKFNKKIRFNLRSLFFEKYIRFG